MRFQEAVEGEWHLYAGALESPLGDGYTAAAAVQRRGSAREFWRDDSLACGHRWTSADEALRYALEKARQVIRAPAAPGPVAAVSATTTASPPLPHRSQGAHHALTASR